MVELYPSAEELHLFVLNGSGINRLGARSVGVGSTGHFCGEFCSTFDGKGWLLGIIYHDNEASMGKFTTKNQLYKCR